jgi:chemotaxis protein methyltransferase CheR
MNIAIKENITTVQLLELVDLVKKFHGFDFGGYTKASFKRRVDRILMLKKLSFYDLKHELVNSPAFFQDFL